MDGLRAVGKEFRQPGTGTFGQKRKQLSRIAQDDNEPQRVAQGNAPSCMEPTGLSGRIFLQVQQELYEGSHIQQPYGKDDEYFAMLHQKY